MFAIRLGKNLLKSWYALLMRARGNKVNEYLLRNCSALGIALGQSHCGIVHK